MVRFFTLFSCVYLVGCTSVRPTAHLLKENGSKQPLSSPEILETLTKKATLRYTIDGIADKGFGDNLCFGSLIERNGQLKLQKLDGDVIQFDEGLEVRASEHIVKGAATPIQDPTTTFAGYVCEQDLKVDQ